MDIPFSFDLNPAREAEIPVAIRQYVETLDRSLAGEVSNAERELLVEEALFVLESSVAEGTLLGKTVEEAIRDALQEYGPVLAVADAHVEGFYEADPRSPIIQLLGRANALAFGLFGCATLAYYILLQVRIYLPVGVPINLPFSPAEVRSVFPEPLPYPDLTPSFFALLGYPLIVPFVLGWVVGRRIPVHAPAAVFRSMGPIALCSFLMGSLLLPNTEGLLFAIWQVIFWIPVGYLTACLSSYLARQRRAKTQKGTAATAPSRTQ